MCNLNQAWRRVLHSRRLTLAEFIGAQNSPLLLLRSYASNVVRFTPRSAKLPPRILRTLVTHDRISCAKFPHGVLSK
jgi:hypothetical protein